MAHGFIYLECRFNLWIPQLEKCGNQAKRLLIIIIIDLETEKLYSEKACQCMHSMCENAAAGQAAS